MNIKRLSCCVSFLALQIFLLAGCEESRIKTRGILITFDNTTSESLMVSLSGPGKGTGTIGMMAPAPNMILRKLVVEDAELPGQYTWTAGDHSGTFTLNSTDDGPICIRIPGGLSQMGDLSAYKRDLSNQSQHRYVSVPEMDVLVSRQSATARDTVYSRPTRRPAVNTPPVQPLLSGGETAEFYMIEGSVTPPVRTASATTIHLPSYSTYNARGATAYQTGGSIPGLRITRPHRTYGPPVYIGSGGNSYFSGTVYPLPYLPIYYPPHGGASFGGSYGTYYPYIWPTCTHNTGCGTSTHGRSHNQRTVIHSPQQLRSSGH